MLEVTITDSQQQRTVSGIVAPFVLGRNADPKYPEMLLMDPYVSRRHLEVQSLSPDRLRLRCVGRSPVTMASGFKIMPNDEAEIALPVELVLGKSGVVITSHTPQMDFLDPPAMQTMMADSAQRPESGLLLLSSSISNERLVQWFENLLALQESVSGLDGFYRQAAKMVVELIGLDRCVVLSLASDPWKVECEYGDRLPNEIIFSRRAVDYVVQYRQTVFDRTVGFSATESLSCVSAFVGSPITNADGEITACLFGVRRMRNEPSSSGVLPIEAQLVQVIAGIISMRIARLSAEAEQVRTQVQLEQFASPALVREMQSNPQWLNANQRELTVLFGDIRGFSRISERLLPQQTFALVRDVMDCITEVILQYNGYIFSFAGDGIAAMWNAPELSSDHVRNACLAAMEIQKRLPYATEQWLSVVGSPIHVGVGVNTGQAIVGNSGSRFRLNYSPLGHTVNLASRVEGATKYFGVPILITEACLAQLDDSFQYRHLGQVALLGIDEPATVYELATDCELPHDHWADYDRAVSDFRNGEIDSAITHAKAALCRYPDDGPTRIFIQRLESGQDLNGPWALPNK